MCSLTTLRKCRFIDSRQYLIIIIIIIDFAFEVTDTFRNCNHEIRLYNSDPLKPHFHIVKLGFTGVYIIFLIFAQKIACGYPLEPPRRGGSNEYPQAMF